MTNIENRDPAEPAGPTATTKSEQRSPKRGAQQKRGAPKRRHQPTTRTPQGARHKAARAAKTAAKPVGGGRGRTPRAESKGANVLRLISRPKGATLAEIRQATGWQAHSVRGFLSTAAKKHGWKIESATNEAHDRVYQVKNGAAGPTRPLNGSAAAADLAPVALIGRKTEAREASKRKKSG